MDTREIVATARDGRFTVSVVPEEFCDKLSDSMDLFGTFYVGTRFSDKYGDLGGGTFTTADDVNELIAEKKPRVFLPLYAYIHSGVSLRLGRFDGLVPQGHAEFDSGVIGFVYVTSEKIRESYGVTRITKAVLEKARKLLESEVNLWNSYFAGDVYGWEIRDTENGNILIESCYGYYGYTDCVEQAKQEVKFYETVDP